MKKTDIERLASRNSKKNCILGISIILKMYEFSEI